MPTRGAGGGDMVAEAQAPQEAEVMERVNTHEAFLRSEGIPVVRGFGVGDLRTIEVKPWARREALGSYVVLDGSGGVNDAYVLEIPPGKATAPQQQLFEEMIYI